MKDLYCAYYTNSDEITKYMVNKLELQSDDIILEPSAGEGVFIDEILNQKNYCRIDAIDINIDAIKLLDEKYKKLPNVTVRHVDTLLDEKLDLYEDFKIFLKHTDTLFDLELDCIKNTNGFYDKIIGNPPYGAWQDYEKRALLKKKYSGYYVKETYTLFLLRCLSLLKYGGKLSFIVPDTFLFLNMHKKIRETLLYNSSIEEILIFPSKFFPGVKFGYSNLSIITLRRSDKEKSLNNIVKITKGFKNVSDLSLPRIDSKPEYLENFELLQKDILNNVDFKFILTDKRKYEFINSQSLKLGDIANIVTGFYSGDNKRFIRRLDTAKKQVKGYEAISTDKIYECKSIFGIETVDEGYIKYLKGASKQSFVRDDDNWYIRWDYETVEYYKSNKKSRFQNSEYYFKKGIAIPMVKSNKIKATLIDNVLFDQSIVGIFVNDEKYIYYVLAFLNNDISSKLIHIINPTANNSANYVKQIPIILPNDEILVDIDDKVKNIIDYKKNNKVKKAMEIEEKLNIVIQDLYSNII